jgi:CRISPR-associated exonuclease Cas4
MDGDGLDDPIPLSALQHAVYCLRQAALIHIERLWEENRFTAEGRIVHLATDEPGQRYSRGVRRVSAMPLASRRLGIAGVADLVEFHREGQGTGGEETRGKAKRHRADEVQLCAQGLCLEEMTGKTVPQGALFYAETRRRVIVPFGGELRRLTEATAASLREVFASGRTPPAEYRADKCRACSLLELCRPRAGARSAKAWREREILANLDAVSGEPPP